MIILYENIKKFRKQMKMSQEELAKRTGYTDRSSIAKIEKGAVDLPQSKIQQFADVFGVTASELMGWEEPKEKTATNNDSGISETKQRLLDLAQNCSEEEALRLLQMMELFLGRK